MDLNKVNENGVVKITIDGRLDATTSPEAEKLINEVLAGGNVKLVVDLSRLEYISSAGLRVLLVAAKGVRQGKGNIVLCGLSEGVKEVFEISGFSSIFNITETLDEAMAAVLD